MTVVEILTSIVRHSFSFLQEAEMVSEVANSKYQSLFFILKNREQELYSLKYLKKKQSSVTLFAHTVSLNPHLLLNLWGCFSLMEWKR